jgi:glyoxylase-like metal-dependent hydrolase (beta-lactamase superfamily II)
MTPEVLPFFHAESNTFSYLVVDPASGEAAIIDPALDYDVDQDRVATASAQALLDTLDARGWQLRWLLETHAHADHLSAGHWLRRQRPGARQATGEGIRQVQRAFAARYRLPDDFRADGSQFDHLFTDGETFQLGTLEARVIAAPGHTPDGVAYLIGDALFPGDSIFMPDGGTARCDFPGGDAGQLYHSIQRLFALPDATRVFVCHDYGPGGRAVAHVTSVGEQRRANVHVREGIDEADFVTQRQARDATLPEPRLMHPAVQANIQGGWHPSLDD